MDTSKFWVKLEEYRPSGSGLQLSNYVTVKCQRFVIENHGVLYPYFLGAADAKELIKVSEAPSFAPDTEHSSIAGEVLKTPMAHWQRPVIADKVKTIAENFDLVGELMPNPVLLAVNPLKSIEFAEDLSGSGIRSGLWTIKVPIPESANEKPLWIIDGQHRLKGMAQTNVVTSPLPFVLLHGEEGQYVPGTLAKIFAQVTTEATSLNKIHQAWMQFTFELDKYANKSPKFRALRTTALLCSSQTLGSKPNPFYGKIQFNPEIDARFIHPGGFRYDVTEFSDLLEDWFFDYLGGPHQFTELELATEISSSLTALKAVVTSDVNRSAFFGDSGEQKYFRDGFIVGVCQYLVNNGAPADWVDVLKSLNFDKTDWDVTTWVNGTGGKAGNVSKRIAFKCFSQIFKSAVLPTGTKDICDYLRGKNAYLKVDYQLLDDKNKLIPKSGQTIIVDLTGREKDILPLPANARYIKITSPCGNVGPVSIALDAQPFAENYNFDSFKKGRILEPNEIKTLKKKLGLKIRAEFYGDVAMQKQITFTFNE